MIIIKSKDEIQKIKKAGEILRDAHNEVNDIIKEDLTY